MRLKKYDLRVCAAACFLDPRFYKKSRVFRSPYQAYTGNDSSRTTEYADSTPLSEALARQNVPLSYSNSVSDLQEELKTRFFCSETGLEPLLSESESENQSDDGLRIFGEREDGKSLEKGIPVVQELRNFDTSARKLQQVPCIQFSEQGDSSFSVLSFWKESEHRYLALAPLAKFLLCIPASSAATERVFSRAGWAEGN